MAVKGRYPIIPFASLGLEDALDIVFDTDNPLMALARKLFDKLRNVEPLPIVRGIGLTPIPRPERLYFWFGEPISTLEPALTRACSMLRRESPVEYWA